MPENSAPVGTLTKNRVRVFADYQSIAGKFYGKEVEGVLELALEEAYYLVDRGDLIVEQNEEPLDSEDFYTICCDVDDEFPQKYQVYSDLRGRGYVVKSGFKFGTHFRVYERGVNPYKEGQKTQREHTKWVVHAVPENYQLSYHEMSRAVRLAQNIRTTMLWAVVDAEDDVTYYEFERVTP